MPGIRKNAQGKTGGTSGISSETSITERTDRIHRKTKKQQDILLREFKRFKDLDSVVYTSLNTYLEYFRDASFNDLTTLFTQEVYNSLAATVVTRFGGAIDMDSIVNFNVIYDSQLFSKYNDSAYSIINGLNRAIEVYKINQQQNVKILALEEKEKILENTELLREYLEQKAKNMNLFETTTNLTLQPILKPQYALYFKRHGPPIDSVFDSEKLAVIIKELLDNGTLSPDDIFIE